MKGLKGRQVMPTPADLKAAVEEFSRRCQDWKTGSRSVCTKCLREWFRPGPATDALCELCCPHTASFRGYMLKANGEACPQVICISCGKRGDISRHDLAPVFDIVLRNNVATRLHVQPCEHCGEVGSELHHWAPRAIFNDADSWPTSWLCPPCHRLWHSAMREAGGRSLPEENRKGPRPSCWYAQDSA